VGTASIGLEPPGSGRPRHADGNLFNFESDSSWEVIVNVLLVSPEFPDTFWSFKHAIKFIRKKASLPPLGLLTVAAMLPEEWNKRLVDLNAQNLKGEDLEWADIAMIGCMTVQRESAARVIKRCRDAGLKIVAGGPLFSSEHEHFPDVDHFVLDEAEETLPVFLSDLERGCPQPIYRAEKYPEISETPIPLWELVDLSRYASMSIQYSRGCPYDCEFCDVTVLFGHRPRTKTSAQITAELAALRDHGWRGRIFFVDDNLIGNKRRLREDLLPTLIEWRKRHGSAAFYTEATINLADDPVLMASMVEAGFDTVFVGIETPAEESLVECSKKQNTRRDLVEDVKKIQRAGMQVQAGFIVGFDNDEPSIFRRQIEFIQRSGIVTAMVGILQAPYGTKLYERLKREERLLGEFKGDNEGTTNFIPKMDVDTLREGYRSILAHIYAPEHFYRRARTFLREYRPRTRTPLSFENALAGIRAFYELGIRSRGRGHYWGLIFWTLFRRPVLLPVAITIAVDGYHCRKISELYIL
jgi:radical SAM superfamily enzyme YgiQ (UPF0313 family)